MIVLNASRIGPNGGLRSFAQAMLTALSSLSDDLSLIIPSNAALTSHVPTIVTPTCLASSSSVSFLRPIMWLVYSAFRFPVSKGAQILSATHHVLPFRKRQIVTVHDLRPFFYPDTVSQKVYFRWFLPRALRRCHKVLTVSNTSKQLLVDVYGLSPEMIHIVPNVIDTRYFGSQPSVGVNTSTNCPYLLAVGCSWQHKNIHELLGMHSIWAGRYRLKIVSGKGQYRLTLVRQVEELGLTKQVDFLDSVDESGLVELMRGCAALVYPSRMEGFGLPPLEAMACGRAVIVSDIPVFRELYGDTPIFVRLGDAQSWASAFTELENDYHEERIQTGIRQAASFSSDRMRDALGAALNIPILR